MGMSRRSAVLFFGSVAGQLLIGNAKASDYPDKPIRLIVPYTVGGGADTMARLIGASMSEILGVNLVPENRGGATGNIGAAIAARSRPDGDTIMLAAANLAISANLYKNLSFNVQSDFAPICLLAETPYIVAVNPKVPARTLQELIALAKASPGKLAYASDETGPSALGMALLTARANINLTAIPYTGTSGGIIAAIGGQVPIIMAPANSILASIKSGQLRALVVTSQTRLSLLPDVPTAAESGLSGFSVNQWYGLVAPAKTPPSVISVLNGACLKALRSPKLRQTMERQVMIPVGNSPTEFAAYLSHDISQWAAAIKVSKLAVPTE
jgi:tripartite-type tricarboxylate transporter receptor subunit TctC